MSSGNRALFTLMYPKKKRRAPRWTLCRMRCSLSLLFRLFGTLWNLVRRLWVCRHRCDGGCICAARSQFGRLVLRCAHVSVHEVLLHAVHHHLHRLRIILRMDPDRLPPSFFFLCSVFFIHPPFQGVALVLLFFPPQPQRYTPP